MTKILYEPSGNEKGTRKVYVDGKYFTELHVNWADESLFTLKEHPYVNLAKLFEGAVTDDVSFESSFGVKIIIEAL